MRERWEVMGSGSTPRARPCRHRPWTHPALSGLRVTTLPSPRLAAGSGFGLLLGWDEDGPWWSFDASRRSERP